MPATPRATPGARTSASARWPWRLAAAAVVAASMALVWGTSAANSGSLACSVHPSGRLGIQVRARGVDLRDTVVPTLAFGPLLGGAVVAVAAVARRLGPD